MPVRLFSLDYRVPQCDTSLVEFPVLVGHAADAQIRLDDHSVGHHHCEIDFFSGSMVVRDLDSVRGTFVNGARIREPKLMPGDHLAIGMLTFLVQNCPENEREPCAVENGSEPRRWQDESIVLAAS